MKRNALIVAFALVLFMPGPAGAEKKGKGKGKEAKEQEAPPPVASEDMKLLQQGHASLVVKNLDKALSLYKQAGEIAPKSPAVHYFIGCALKIKGDHDLAVESFRTAYLMASGKEEAWKGAALAQVAMTLEAAGKWADAKKAWQDYVELAAGGKTVINLTGNAKERIEAIEKMLDMAEKYAPVRKLIEEGGAEPK